MQKYIDDPLLIDGRKFDIRTYAMLTSVNGHLKGFAYEDGYLRTSSATYSGSNFEDRMIHLTNDSIQKNSVDYGKYEKGNKIDYLKFQDYLDRNHKDVDVCFTRDVMPQIKRLTSDCFRAVAHEIDPNRRQNTFEIFGLDFMLDENFNLYLIEVNTNPVLDMSNPVMHNLVPAMLNNALRVVVDPLFMPAEHVKAHAYDGCELHKFELVFDEALDTEQSPYLN